MKKITEDDLFKAIAKEIQQEKIQPDEYTIEMFQNNIEKQGVSITIATARRMLTSMVKDKKWTSRKGRGDTGKDTLFYKPIE